MLPALHPPKGGTMGHKTLQCTVPNNMSLYLPSFPKMVLLCSLKISPDVYNLQSRGEKILKSILNSDIYQLQGTFYENSTMLDAQSIGLL